MLAWPVASAAHLCYPEPPPVDRLASLVVELDNAVGQGELDVAPQLVGRVLTEQQQHCAGLGEPAGQVEQCGPQLAFAGEVAQHLGAVEHHDRGFLVQRFPDDLRHQWLKPVRARRQQEVTQVDVLDCCAQGFRIEEGERLQVPDELGMRLGHRRVVDGLVLGGAAAEANLLGQDRLAGAGRAGHDHHGPGLESAVEHEVQPCDVGS